MSEQGVARVLMKSTEGQDWEPVVGQETEQVIETLGIRDVDDRNTLRSDSIGILRRCVPPGSDARSLTGLTVGYIQSGKTSSFETVTALARDNHYAIVIVVAGMNKPLFRQSVSRLEHDLRLQDRRDRAWMHIENPGVQDADRIRGPLQDWREGDTSQTVLLMVMKNHRRLRNLSAVLEALDLNGVPVLVVDDEADQASLNNLTQRRQQSSTYSMLLEVRSRLPGHTFLQYTATPQAPLLISLIDALSPDFARVLEPGRGYTGGRTFFLERPELVREIPDTELPVAANNLVAPPDSLLAALRLYFGVSCSFRGWV